MYNEFYLYVVMDKIAESVSQVYTVANLSVMVRMLRVIFEKNPDWIPADYVLVRLGRLATDGMFFEDREELSCDSIIVKEVD